MRDPVLTPEQLRAKRTRAGLTQEELADLTGFSRDMVNSWEIGRRAITREAAQTLYTFFVNYQAEVDAQRVRWGALFADD